MDEVFMLKDIKKTVLFLFNLFFENLGRKQHNSGHLSN